MEAAVNTVLFENTVLALLKAAPGIGSLQLRKALLIIDVLYHSLYGETLTGISYIKHRHGPVPDAEANAFLFDMTLFKIDVIDEPVGLMTKNAHYAIAEPDYSLFNDKAINIIKDTAGFVAKNTAGKLSELTHDVVYDNTVMGGVIPITSFYSLEVVPGPEFSKIEKETLTKILEEAEKNGEIDIAQFCEPVEAGTY
jgi:hypothetical protein